MKQLLIFFAFVFSIEAATAQHSSPLALNLYGNYIFKDEIHLDGFRSYAKEGFQYGVGLEYFLESIRSLELKYLRQDTHFPLYGPAGTHLNEGKDKALISYVLLSGTNYFERSPQQVAVPYGGLGAGVGILDTENGGTYTKFAWDMKLGVKIKTSSQISFKFQATLQSISAAVGSDFYLTAGGGTIALPDYATLLQFGLGGSLNYRF